jgi:hypothetical protein
MGAAQHAWHADARQREVAPPARLRPHSLDGGSIMYIGGGLLVLILIILLLIILF